MIKHVYINSVQLHVLSHVPFESKPMKWQECVGAEEAPDDVLRESDDPLRLPRAPLAPRH